VLRFSGGVDSLADVAVGLGGAVKRFCAAGDDELHGIVIDVERWRTLRGIKRAEAAAGSGADAAVVGKI
jgi:hypothetical protein